MSVFLIDEHILVNCICEENEIAVPDDVTVVDMFAFAHSHALKAIDLGNRVTKLGNYAFADCKNLAAVVIPDSVTHLGEHAFSKCVNLKTVTFGSGVTALRDCTFFGCKNLVHVTLPSRLQRIGEDCFWKCESLRSLHLPNSVTVIERHAFHGCKELCEIHASDAVFSVLWNALLFDEKISLCFNRLAAGCELRACEKHYILQKLNDIVLHAISLNRADGLPAALALKQRVPLHVLERWIDESESAPTVRAFLLKYKNQSYTARQIEQIHQEEIEKALGLRERTVEDWEAIFRFTAKHEEITICDYLQTDSAVEIPSTIGQSTVTAIGERAFSDNPTLQSVFLPDTVTTIDKYAFGGCMNLSGVILGNAVNTIANGAFMRCTALQTLSIPDSVTHIHPCAFIGCCQLILRGKADSYAEHYAKELAIPFEKE